MEFGKLNEDDLSHADLSLPADAPENKKIFAKDKHKNKQVFVGCAKWGRKDWVGKFYPEKTKEKDFLSYYAKLFNCIEFNAAFYKNPTEAQVLKWKEQVPPHFKFCPKFPQVITHMKRLRNCEQQVDDFLKSMYAFGDNLGPIFLMPHPQMQPAQLDVIENFITSLPTDIDLFLELRHPDWFAGGINQNLYDFLVKRNLGLVITDAAGRRDCLHMHASNPETFIRFVGNSLHPTDYTRIDDWVNRLKIWLDEGLHKMYFFMHQHEELHSPELSKYLVEKLNAVCHLNIPEIKLISDDDPLQQSLF